MVKQVIIEEKVLKYFENNIGQEHVSAGIIVGQTTSNKDYIADLIKCPKQAVDENIVNWKNLNDIDGSWVAGHAAQIISSLPGGINIIGLFLIVRSTDGKKVIEKQKHMIYQMYKLVSKTGCENYLSLYGNQESLFWTTLHVDGENGSIVNMRQFDMKDNNDIGRPIDLKKSQVPIQWDCLQTSVMFEKFYENSHSTDESKVLQVCMKDLCDSVSLSVITLENIPKLNEEILNPGNISNIGKTSKKQKTAPKLGSPKTFTCQVFIPSVFTEIKDLSTECDLQQLNLSGIVTGKAFVAPGSSVGDAFSALKCDLIRSIYQRFEILTDELKEVNSDIINTSLCLPRRVFGSRDKTSGSILYSEYLSPDELLEDCLERYRDNLDLTIKAEDIALERSMEKFAPPEMLLNSEILSDHQNEPKHIDGGSRKTNVIIAVGASVVAVLGWLFSGLLINEN